MDFVEDMTNTVKNHKGKIDCINLQAYDFDLNSFEGDNLKLKNNELSSLRIDFDDGKIYLLEERESSENLYDVLVRLYKIVEDKTPFGDFEVI